MDILKYIFGEISYLVKSSFDIFIQKIEQIFNRSKTGL